MKQIVAQIADRSSMETFFDKLYTARRKRPQLKALVLLTDLGIEDLEKLVSSRKKLSKKYFADVSPVDDHLYMLKIQRIIGQQEKTGCALLDTSQTGAWILFTNEGSYFVAHVLERMFENLYPEVSRLYMNYSQMNALLKAIEQEYQGHATVTFFVTRRETLERQHSNKRGTFLLWEIRGEEELITQMEKYRVTVDKLDFLIRDAQGTVLLQAHMSRNGLFKLRFGNFRSFYKNAVHNAISTGLGLKKFYSYRQRMEKDGDIILNPFQISYSSDFRRDQLVALGDQLSKGYSSSIIHSGNPYFVATICDYKDGSSFGVTALGNIVTITPISRAAPSAVWKLTNRIQELLGDGQLSSTISC